MEDLQRYQDSEGRFVRWPAKKRVEARTAIAEYLASQFEPNRDYTEKEVNQILNENHSWNDPAFLRRELVERGLIGRTEYGDRYWRMVKETTDPA